VFNRMSFQPDHATVDAVNGPILKPRCPNAQPSHTPRFKTRPANGSLVAVIRHHATSPSSGLGPPRITRNHRVGGTSKVAAVTLVRLAKIDVFGVLRFVPLDNCVALVVIALANQPAEGPAAVGGIGDPALGRLIIPNW